MHPEEAVRHSSWGIKKTVKNKQPKFMLTWQTAKYNDIAMPTQNHLGSRLVDEWAQQADGCYS